MTVRSQPLYKKIYDDIAQKIATGQIAYMEQLPNLQELCERYGVSEAPVRQALGELERAHLVLRQRGRGKGTVAIKRLVTRTMRVLLMDDIDIYRNPIEIVHEVFDILAGMRATAREMGTEIQMISPASHDTLSLANGETGYLIVAQGTEGYERGVAIAARHNAPYVLVNTPTAAPPCVRVDMEAAAFIGTNYLAQLGHKRIAFVGGTKGEWHAPRYAGYLRALEKNHLPQNDALIQLSNGVDAAQDERALHTLMALPKPPTAIFAGSDYRALHLLAAARRREIAVPQQLSLCGYDDISEVACVEPALTTVYHPRAELGSEAVRLLSRLLSGETVDNADVLVAPQVVVRASCAPPRA